MVRRRRRRRRSGGGGGQGAVQLRRHERHHVMRAEHAGFMGASKDGCPTHKNNSKKRLEW